jgi:hypothetical protein
MKGINEMNSTTETTWRELFPKGRPIFYEGDEPQQFAEEIRTEFGFDPSADELWDGPGIMVGPNGERWADVWDRTHQFLCPPQHLDAIYGSQRWPMGS